MNEITINKNNQQTTIHISVNKKLDNATIDKIIEALNKDKGGQK